LGPGINGRFSQLIDTTHWGREPWDNNKQSNIFKKVVWKTSKDASYLLDFDEIVEMQKHYSMTFFPERST